MSEKVTIVSYQNPDIGNDRTYVHQILPETITPEGAEKVLGLLVSAYQDVYEDLEFSGPGGPVGEGTFYQKYRGAPGAAAAYAAAMERNIKNGSSYWYINPFSQDPSEKIFADGDMGEVYGLIKVSPSSSGPFRRLYGANCYINDLIVAPPYQYEAGRANHHFSSMLLHAVYLSGNYRPRAKVAFDTFDGAPDAPRRAKLLGFEPVQSARIDPFEVGGQTLPQTRYTSRPGFYLQKHAELLESHVPLLQTGQVEAAA